jgi:ADP-ribose pyrophosphatase
MDFKPIDSAIKYQGRVFDVRQDHVRLPNGTKARLDIVDHPPAVVLVPILEDDQIIFIRQYRHAAAKTILELPAGVLEIGEEPEFCALRELREETGMSAGSIQKIGGIFLAPGYSTEYLHIFLASELKPDPLPADKDEFIEVDPKTITQAYSMAEAGTIEDAKTLAALLLARPHIWLSVSG